MSSSAMELFLMSGSLLCLSRAQAHADFCCNMPTKTVKKKMTRKMVHCPHRVNHVWF